MTIRVLHIFSPNYKHRFGGPIYDWKYAFNKWDNPQVEHLVLDYDQKKPLKASTAFDFKVSTTQLKTSRKNRSLWVLNLFYLLPRYRSAYDVIHFHLLWWGGLLAAKWAKTKRIPTVYQSVLLGADTPGPILKQRQGRIKERLLSNFSVILPISEPLSEDYYAHGYSKNQVITLMNSVDTELFHPVESQQEQIRLRQKYDLPTEATILIFTGSLIHRKGVDLLVEGFLDALQKHPNLFLLLVGPQNKGENPSLDEDFVVNLKRQIVDKGANERVQFKGLIKDRAVLAELYHTADGFVFPSRREGLPNVVLEAMTSGLPVIASDLPGLKPVITHGQNGFIVPIDDIDSLSQAIINVVENPYAATQLGKNARNHILTHHSFSTWQTYLVKIYQNLFQEKL